MDVRERLRQERIVAQARIAQLTQDVATYIDSASSTTGDDEHDPEGATIGFERAQASALLDAAHRHLGEVDAAEQRLEAGAYGRCETCHRPISPPRLEARPTARTCIDCARN